MISLSEDNKILGYELLSSCPGIFHFVTTRQGGFSKDKYASFNCSPFSGDDPIHVQQNQRLLHSLFPYNMGELVIPFQTHGTEVCLIDNIYVCYSEDERREMLYGVDAMITSLKYFCLCVSTADCIPILLYDLKNEIIGVAHAGWRGTVNCIAERVIEKMHNCFGTDGRDVLACIGPGISFDSFEVGDEVYETFREAGFEMSRISARKPDTDKWHIDLWEANRMQLLHCGLEERNIEMSGICTYQNHTRFFSARRLGVNSGRVLSGIMLK